MHRRPVRLLTKRHKTKPGVVYCMNDFYLSEIEPGGHIHFIGIGGISMSALAQICVKRGYKVTGSDMKESHITRQLAALGVTIYTGQRKKIRMAPTLLLYGCNQSGK